MDAFSTGALLAPSFRRLGFGAISVQTSNRIDASLARSLVVSDFDHHLDHQDLGFGRTLDFLRRFDICAVLPGCDSGVILADALAAELGVARNPAETTPARRSKFAMHEALRAGGLLAARQIKSASLDEILSWYHRQPFRKVVIKPEYAARSEGVAFCVDEAELGRAFRATIGTTNLFGITNTEMVVQEYMSGPEYMVNTMSVDGRHFVTDMWVGIDNDEEKLSADLYAELVHPGDRRYEELSDYVQRVLTCVGLRTGPAHVEIRHSPRGPVLIELGARLAGAMSPGAFVLASGFDPVQLTVDAFARPDLALRALERGGACRHARLVFFHSDRGGTVCRSPDLSEMCSLESVREVLLTVRQGDRMRRTDDMVGRPGYAYLVHDDEVRLEEDYRRFRAVEQKLYRSILED